MSNWKTGYSNTLNFWQYSVYFTYTQANDGVDYSMTGASPACGETWSQINWPYVGQQVRRLQMRIAKAIQGW